MPRFKSIRLAWDDFKSLAHGWYFRLALPKTLSSQMPADWLLACQFSTKIKWRDSLGPANNHRIHNMRLCCELINGIILCPREIFSMRRIVGDATPERGFKSGPMLVNGKMTLSCGGGLCQISSVLFNIALLAGLDILERHNHSVDLWGEDRFIDLGRDATYAYGLKDLKFRNPLPHPVMLVMEVLNEQEVCARVLAPQLLNSRPRIETQVLRKITPRGVRGQNATVSKNIVGWDVYTKRIIDLAGDEIVTYEARDIYKPISIDGNAGME